MGRYSPKILLGVGAVLLAASLVAWLRRTEITPRPGPENIQQAIAIAEGLGLFCASDEYNGVPIRCLVIAESPLTRERAGDLRVNNPWHPGWIGTVRLYWPWQSMLPNYDPTCSAVWGEFFIYGDPKLIQKLTGRSPGDYRGATVPFR